VHVAADHGVHPDAGLLAEDDVADNLSGFIYIAGIGDAGTDPLVGADHADSLPFDSCI
jgi:hypothetical protein